MDNMIAISSLLIAALAFGISVWTVRENKKQVEAAF